MAVFVVVDRVVVGHVHSLTMDRVPLDAFDMCEISEYWGTQSQVNKRTDLWAKNPSYRPECDDNFRVRQNVVCGREE